MNIGLSGLIAGQPFMPDYSLELVTPPSAEPVALAEAVTWARLDECDRDEAAALIQAAREHVEFFTGRALMEQTWKLRLDRFPACYIEVPRPPLKSVESVAYVDLDGNTQTLDPSSYEVDTAREPGRVRLPFGGSWPQTRGQSDAVTIEFKAGYGTERAKVPQVLKTVIKALALHWFENREPVVVGTIQAELPMHVRDLLWSYRVVEAV